MTRVEMSKPVVVPKEIHVGTEQKDVYKDTKLLELFNYADKNGDKVIDESEMRRCKGPLLTVEKNNKTLEMYPGLRADDIKSEDSEFILAYRDLDCLPTDGVLSKDEIEKYPAYVGWKDYQKEFTEKTKDIGLSLTTCGVLGTILSFVVGGSVGRQVTQKAQSTIYNKYIPNNKKIHHYYDYDYDNRLRHNYRWKLRNYNEAKAKLSQREWDKFLKDAPKGLKNAADGKYSKLISGGIALLGTGASIYAAINTYTKAQKVKKSLEDLKPFDQQYKHIYNS